MIIVMYIILGGNGYFGGHNIRAVVSQSSQSLLHVRVLSRLQEGKVGSTIQVRHGYPSSSKLINFATLAYSHSIARYLAVWWFYFATAKSKISYSYTILYIIMVILHCTAKSECRVNILLTVIILLSFRDTLILKFYCCFL